MHNDLNDVDILINKFLVDRQLGLVTLHKLYFKNDNYKSYRVFIEELFYELQNTCKVFISKNNCTEGLEDYLFYAANDFCKKQNPPLVKKSKDFICPGCLFLGKQNLLINQSDLICQECLDCYKKTDDPKWIKFFTTFKKHAKIGFRCIDCSRFIPQPFSKSTDIICPYIDCLFVGSSNDLKKMIHPNSDSKIENFKTIKENFHLNNEINVLDNTEISEEMKLKIKTITEVIDQQISAIHWDSFNFNVKHKLFAYQAFKKIIEQCPIEMSSYLLEKSRSGGFQHKLFQEYVSILESNLPLIYKKNNEVFSIQSLLDSKLSLFDGISSFEGQINNKGVIKNNTQEIYIGGRKASYVKPFYIGKLLNVVLSDTDEPIMHLVESYSFSRIKLTSIPKSLKVKVSHLRIAPHYQMGAMVYINRARTHIIDEVNYLLKNQI